MVHYDQTKMVAELMMVKARLQEKIETENLTIHNAIHTDRDVAKKALLRKKSLMQSLESVQKKIEIMQDQEDLTIASWKWFESLDTGVNTKVISFVLFLGISALVGTCLKSLNQE